MQQQLWSVPHTEAREKSLGKVASQYIAIFTSFVVKIDVDISEIFAKYGVRGCASFPAEVALPRVVLTGGGGEAAGACRTTLTVWVRSCQQYVRIHNETRDAHLL
jgi:hypothetical protein